MAYQLDKEKAKEVLLEEGRIPPARIPFFLKDFPTLYKPLGSAVEQWLSDQSIAPVEVEGLSIQDLMQNRQSHFLAAVRDLNRLLDESVPKERRKRWRVLLEKPVRIE